MEDSCYICRRTRSELDRLNEETRTRVYLQYFTNAHGLLDELNRRTTFLQRLKDEEGGDAHLRINAHQVFADPQAYEKMMPWIGRVMEIAHDSPLVKDSSKSIGELLGGLLAEGHNHARAVEEALDQVRAAFAPGQHAPLALEAVSVVVTAPWVLGEDAYVWRTTEKSGAEPLRRVAGRPRPELPMPIFLCTICRAITKFS